MVSGLYVYPLYNPIFQNDKHIAKISIMMRVNPEVIMSKRALIDLINNKPGTGVFLSSGFFILRFCKAANNQNYYK
ncbi:hypothetical protein, partial [Paenibacillus validus]|uniref:hypothetical protein n=1 Tax=Paenibacillus validus TaxID=44253 RepID=UPI001C3F8B97